MALGSFRIGPELKHSFQVSCFSLRNGRRERGRGWVSLRKLSKNREVGISSRFVSKKPAVRALKWDCRSDMLSGLVAPRNT